MKLLILGNKEAFIRKVILPMQNKIYSERISSKKAKEKELETSINQKRSKKRFDDSVNAFKENYKILPAPRTQLSN